LRPDTGWRSYAGGVARRLHVRGDLSLPLDELEVRVSRSSGPGGQHANVTASRVEVVFDVAASPSLSDAQRERLVRRLGARVTATAQDTRSQTRNRELAFERLAARLAAALEPRRPRHATRPTRSSRVSRLADKRHRGEVKRGRRPPGGDE
jgi:ribosome-associated protein